MPNGYGRSAWDIGQLYRAQDVGMRIPFASLLGTPGDQPAQPLPSTMQWREGIPLPTGQVQSKPAQEGRKDDYLSTSLDMLQRMRLPLPSAASVASFLPGGGLVAAGESSRAIPEAVRAGNYGQAGLSALETALNVGGEALPPLKAAAAALPGLMRRYGHLTPQKTFERGLEGEMLGRTWMAGGVKPRTDPREWTADVDPGVLPIEAKTFDPTSIPLGSAILPLPGDLTAAGGSIRGTMGQALTEPVGRFGGADFMRLDPRYSWASGGGVITSMQRRAREAAEAGAPQVYGAHAMMSPTSGQFSHHEWQTALRQTPASAMTPQAKTDFDAAFRKQYPDWPGLEKSKESEAFLQRTGAARVPFMKQIGSGTWQAKGAPEIGPIRWAVTDPRLVVYPTGATGSAISRLDPMGQPIKDPALAHPSYPVNAPTLGYAGSTESLVPKELFWLDYFRRPDVRAMPTEENRWYGFQRALPTQTVTPEWQDLMARYQEQARRGGR